MFRRPRHLRARQRAFACKLGKCGWNGCVCVACSGSGRGLVPLGGAQDAKARPDTPVKRRERTRAFSLWTGEETSGCENFAAKRTPSTQSFCVQSVRNHPLNYPVTALGEWLTARFRWPPRSRNRKPHDTGRMPGHCAGSPPRSALISVAASSYSRLPMASIGSRSA